MHYVWEGFTIFRESSKLKKISIEKEKILKVCLEKQIAYEHMETCSAALNKRNVNQNYTKSPSSIYYIVKN